VPDVCTCGAKLPPDARFCHKCGKPQRVEPVFVEEVEDPLPPPIELAPPPPPRIGFHNRLALRVALIAWFLTFAGSALFGLAAVPQAFVLLWWPAGGFFAVYLYRRRSGQRLSVMSGAHLGWISGLFGFIMAIIGLAVSYSDPVTLSKMRQQLQSSGFPDANVSQVMVFLSSPAGVLAIVLSLFAMFTLLPAFGGALGAKLLDRD
jgi:hypothetical protein